jgi:hypothetical protein
MQGLLSWDAYVEWNEAKLGKKVFLPCLCNSDSLSQYKTIPRSTLKLSSRHYSNLPLLSSSIFHLSSHALQLTGHHLVTPLQHSLLLVPFFLTSGVPRYLSKSLISNTFMPPMQWSMSYSHLFAGNTH